MSTGNPLTEFDSGRLAYFEKENYVAYYQKRWLKLLYVSISMVKEAYNLSLLQAVYGAYLVARAEIAFAPFPNNDIPRAEAYMRRFFALIKTIHHLDFDVNQLARAEVNWWGVHRRLFGQIENHELVEALANAYAIAYGTEVPNLNEAAHYRAQGMYYSDVWVNQGKERDSHLLLLEEKSLARGYEALKSMLPSDTENGFNNVRVPSQPKEEYPGHGQLS